MKFGSNLHKYHVPLWAGSYLDYDGLKNLIKLSRAEAAERGEAPDRSAVLGKIQCEIDNVQIFYHKLYTTLWDQVSKFCISPDFLQQESWEGVDQQELLYFWGVFIQCRSELKKIQWYGIVNADGFKRLLEKLSPARPSGATSTTLEDVKSKLSSAQFFSQTDSLRDLQLLQRAITSINDIVSRAPSVSGRSLLLNHFVSHYYPSLNDSDIAYEAIKRDDVSRLDRFIQDNIDFATVEQGRLQMLILVFIQLSIICGSSGCVGRLLLLIKSVREDDCTIKNYLPLVIIRILIKTGQLKLINDPLNQELTHIQVPGNSIQATDDAKNLLRRVLSELGANAQAALLTRDSSFSCIPLQYAAQYGLSEACELLLSHMQGANINNAISSPEFINWQDCLGSSPLRVAITRGDSKISKLLLRFYRREQPPVTETGNLLSGALLADAVKSDPGILQELVAARADVDHQGPHGETALFIAARAGDEESVKTLLSHKASTSIAEKVRGWTPLIVASVEGHLRIAQLLIEAGATQRYQDLWGWRAIDHAAFRGHITLAKKLREFPADSRTTSGDVPCGRATVSRSVEPIRIPLSECLILVNLGSFDSCKYRVAASLGPGLAAEKPTAESELGFSIEICLVGKQDSGHTVDLPILEETVNKPWAFYSKDPDSAKIMFKIYRKATNAQISAESVHIGSGIALVSSLKQGLAFGRESLVRNHNTPILAKNSLEHIGTVNFSFLLVKPHLQSTSFTSTGNFLWKNGAVTKIVGHRGLGQNFLEHKHLSIGENTIQSFLTAIDLGADAVELDVQLTKDHVPVVYHDFLVSETGTDAWMHSISLKQFKHISDSQSGPVKTSAEEFTARRLRSRSLDTRNDYRITDLTERMKLTFGFKVKGFKANTRGNYIQEPFITLDDLLSKTPVSMTLNVEIKYPMLFEADEWKSDNIAIELNLFVDTILSSILSHPSCRSRSVMFSSFSPEICILISLKQTTFPIFFLSDSGNWPTDDIRASSLQQAIHFAKRWALDGIVMSSEPFVYAPKLVGLAKGKGLVTASYGELNNEPDCAKIQAAAGLDIIIVDAVRLISETLKSTE